MEWKTRPGYEGLTLPAGTTVTNMYHRVDGLVIELDHGESLLITPADHEGSQFNVTFLRFPDEGKA